MLLATGLLFLRTGLEHHGTTKSFTWSHLQPQIQAKTCRPSTPNKSWQEYFLLIIPENWLSNSIREVAFLTPSRWKHQWTPQSTAEELLHHSESADEEQPWEQQQLFKTREPSPWRFVILITSISQDSVLSFLTPALESAGNRAWT